MKIDHKTEIRPDKNDRLIISCELENSLLSFPEIIRVTLIPDPLITLTPMYPILNEVLGHKALAIRITKVSWIVPVAGKALIYGEVMKFPDGWCLKCSVVIGIEDFDNYRAFLYEFEPRDFHFQ